MTHDLTTIIDEIRASARPLPIDDDYEREVPRALVDRLRAALATSADTGPARLVAEAIAGHAMEVAGTWYCVPTETLA